MIPAIEDIKSQLESEIRQFLLDSRIGEPISDEELLSRFQKYATGLIADREGVTPDRVKLFNLAFNEKDRTITFNGYQILSEF